MSDIPDIDSIAASPPYSFPQARKQAILLAHLNALTRRHYENCEGYRNVIDNAFGGLPKTDYQTLEDIPFLPVSLFKTHALKSIADDAVIKVLKSSGTTGQQVSQIFLDKRTAELQAIVLVRIMQHFLGKARRPMIIVDHPNVVRDRRSFSARGAGIMGMMQFGRKPVYALDDDMRLDAEAVANYITQADGQPILLFGFTFMVWQHLVREMEERGLQFQLPEGSVLIHSGGWKKLENLKVSPEEFDQRFRKLTGAQASYNFYGMVEQVGGVFMENPKHALHASNFSHVIVRDVHTLKPLPFGSKGLLQVMSILPQSYPGHSLLTEDLGSIEGEDLEDACMYGRYFRVHGRVAKAELRGCSDTYAASTT